MQIFVYWNLYLSQISIDEIFIFGEVIFIFIDLLLNVKNYTFKITLSWFSNSFHLSSCFICQGNEKQNLTCLVQLSSLMKRWYYGLNVWITLNRCWNPNPQGDGIRRRRPLEVRRSWMRLGLLQLREISSSLPQYKVTTKPKSLSRKWALTIESADALILDFLASRNLERNKFLTKPPSLRCFVI